MLSLLSSVHVCMFSNLSGSLCEEALLLVWTHRVCHGGLKEDVTAHDEQSHPAVCLLTDLLNVQKKLQVPSAGRLLTLVMSD